jgi:hypothetical protein
MAMTLDELLAREAIRDTIMKYNMSGDSLRAEDYAACFTQDGVIESPRGDGTFNFRFESRAEILAWQKRWREAKPGEQGDAVVRKATLVRHNVTTCKIDVTGPETAKARTYWFVVSNAGPDHCGVYMDDFRKVDDQWLIARRRVKTEWNAPGSLFLAPVED